MPLLMVLLWFFGAVALLAISFAFIKSMCDGPPSNRTTPAAAAANTTTTNNNNNDGLTAGAAASQDVLSTLPVFVYSLAAQKKKLNCSVCLMDFKEAEKGRFLPRCFHCFHVECIDVWLASHLVCPVCRASVDPEAPDLAAV